MKAYPVEIYTRNGEKRARIKADNGRKLYVSTQGYNDKRDLIRSLWFTYQSLQEFFDDPFNEVAFCSQCETEMTIVRPGKHQCDNQNCKSNN